LNAVRLRLGACLALVLVGLLIGAASSPAAGSPNLVISQIYGAGGNAGSTQTHDYIEIFNRSGSDVPLNGLSLQYASATGTGNFGATSTQLTELPSITLPAGKYLLVQEASGASPVPPPSFTADVIDPTPIAMAAGAGKVALVTGATTLGCNGGSAPCDAAALARVVDLVGYGSANFFEGAAAPTLTATTAAFRANAGCKDTDNNANDFTAAAPAPRNLSTDAHVCDNRPTISVATAPLNPAAGSDMTISAAVTPGFAPNSTGLEVNCDLSWADLTSTTPLFDDGTHGDATAGDLTFTLQFTIPSSTTPGPRVGSCGVSDEQGRSNSAPYAVTVSPAVTDTAPDVGSHTPATGETDVAADANIGITFNEPVDAADGWYTIVCGSSGTHSASVTGTEASYLLNPDTDFSAGETCTVTIVAAHVTDQDTDDPPDNMAGDVSWSFTVASPPTAIHDIQGAAHISPRAGQLVANVLGIVTALRSNGYYMQDPSPDADPATSEAIFVFTSSAPVVTVGTLVSVNGRVQEFRPGGASSTNLTTTELTSPTTTPISTGNALPPVTVIGAGGRVPPTQVIEDDATGDVETSGTFDPANDGIDFYESLEGMRLQVDNPVVVGPRNSFGEIFVLADDGAGQGPRTSRGGIVITSSDFNPERIQFDDALLPGSTPNANVGDHFTTSAVGVLDYDFGNYELELTAPLTTVSSGLAREVTELPAANELAVATFNVENLDAAEPQSKFDALAHEIVDNLRSPDVIALEEIQDNNGATNDSVVAADQTLGKLAAAVLAAGGPTYDWRQIDPVDDQDGGEPGGNIRVGFFFRTDRGLSFVDRPGGTSTAATDVTGTGTATQLTFSPGRIDPTNGAWNSSRKPLAAEFVFRGQKVFLIANHFNSKGGDQPLFGRSQPPVRSSEVQRHQQAQIVNDFVDSILAADGNAKVVVLGDINDFEFSQTMTILEGGVLHDLMKTLPQAERYSYVFEGNSQTLDHIVVSNSLFGGPFEFDPVHVNAEFFNQLSDHDPSVARFTMNSAPTVDAGGPYTVAEGGSVSVAATGSDSEGDTLTYAWDLDDNGTFETGGQTATFSAATIDGPATRTIHVRVSDGASSTVDDATVNVTNVEPTATFNAPASTFAGFPFTLSLTSPHDPSAADTAAGFTYAFDCGSGYGAFGTSSSASCPTTNTGTLSVGGKIRDKDGGVSEYRRTVSVVVTFASLCDLVHEVVSDPTVVQGLCDKLTAAAEADARGNTGAKEKQLQAFRNQVDAQTGISISASDAELLKRLSRRL
jgi:predicted extracellular nuclease